MGAGPNLQPWNRRDSDCDQACPDVSTVVTGDEGGVSACTLGVDVTRSVTEDLTEVSPAVRAGDGAEARSAALR